ncbi:transcriptional repressor [Nocardia sp. NPDC046763]|uniref:transcriptional repressor n=1 Tax=Nocardia sp. NPDC046763 TaxID=3155256 RepID=UPI00340CCC28
MPSPRSASDSPACTASCIGSPSKKLIEAQRAEDSEFLYRIRRHRGHHHNLLCRSCGRAEQFTLDDLEHHTEHIARHHGYTNLDHHIDLYGTCPDCASATG